MTSDGRQLVADRRRALKTVRRAYRDGKLTGGQTSGLRAAGVDLDTYAGAPLAPGVNDLATVNPNLAQEWHPCKNGDLTPQDVTAGSNKRVWWKCATCGGEWEASVIHRAKNETGCPYCAGKKVLSGFNDLATADPKLAAEWHPTKNGDLRPCDVVPGSHKKVWWRCDRGHEWEARVSNRFFGKQGCPHCASERKRCSTLPESR